MTENQLIKLAMYETLENKGLLLILPCKLGETVYRVYADDCGNQPCSGNCNTCPFANWKVMPVKFSYDLISEFDKTVFLDEYEANKVKNEFELKNKQ